MSVKWTLHQHSDIHQSTLPQAARLFSTDFLRSPTNIGILDVPLTLSAWFYPNTVPNAGIVGFFDSGSVSNRWVLYNRDDGSGDKLTFFRDDGSVNHSHTTNTINATAWNHGVVRTASANSAEAILNGDLANRGTSVDSRTFPSTIDRVCIGRLDDSSPGTYFDGRIAHVAIWRALLYDVEVLALNLGQSPLSIQPDNLVAYWSLTDLSGRDELGHHHLTEGTQPGIAAGPPKITYPFVPRMRVLTPAVVGRTTYNTDPRPLGMFAGVGRWIGTHGQR